MFWNVGFVMAIYHIDQGQNAIMHKSRLIQRLFYKFSLTIVFTSDKHYPKWIQKNIAITINIKRITAMKESKFKQQSVNLRHDLYKEG